MSELVIWNTQLPVDQQVQAELVHHVDQMQLIAEVAKEAMDEISNIHGYAEYKTVTTLAAAEAIRKAATLNGTGAIEEVAHKQRTLRYLERTNQIIELASGKIVRQVDSVSNVQVMRQAPRRTLLSRLLEP